MHRHNVSGFCVVSEGEGQGLSHAILHRREGLTEPEVDVHEHQNSEDKLQDVE